jgi:hypothetical protein
MGPLPPRTGARRGRGRARGPGWRGGDHMLIRHLLHLRRSGDQQPKEGKWGGFGRGVGGGRSSRRRPPKAPRRTTSWVCVCCPRRLPRGAGCGAGGAGARCRRPSRRGGRHTTQKVVAPPAHRPHAFPGPCARAAEAGPHRSISEHTGEQGRAYAGLCGQDRPPPDRSAAALPSGGAALLAAGERAPGQAPSQCQRPALLA